jgi:hypothetical protein
MKLKIGLGVLIVVAVVLGALFLGDFRTQTTNNDLLETKIQTDTLSLQKIGQAAKTANNEVIVLNAKIAEAQNGIKSSDNIISGTVNANNIMKAIFEQGSLYQVTLIPLSTQPWITVDRNNSTLRVFTVALSASGDAPNLFNFIKWLQASPFSSLVIENMRIAKSSDAENSSGLESKINLAIYSK